jgi:hypothetical protein
MPPEATGSAARTVCTGCIPSWRKPACELVLPTARADNKSRLAAPRVHTGVFACWSRGAGPYMSVRLRDHFLVLTHDLGESLVNICVSDAEVRGDELHPGGSLLILFAAA